MNKKKGDIDTNKKKKKLSKTQNDKYFFYYFSRIQSANPFTNIYIWTFETVTVTSK